MLSDLVFGVVDALVGFVFRDAGAQFVGQDVAAVIAVQAAEEIQAFVAESVVIEGQPRGDIEIFQHAVVADIQAGIQSQKIGDRVWLGSYEQDNNFFNGTEPIEWTVIQVQDGTALLLSRYVLDEKKYDVLQSDDKIKVN